MTEREMSYGEKAVGLAFNPGGNETVATIKQKYAELIDLLEGIRATTASDEVKRLSSIAITEAQAAQMWAVKAITWRD